MADQDIKVQKAKTFAVFGLGLVALITGWLLPEDGGVLEQLYPVGLLVIGLICMLVAAKMARTWNTPAAVKEAAQAGRKARIYALVGCSIAAFVIAYQFTIAAGTPSLDSELLVASRVFHFCRHHAQICRIFSRSIALKLREDGTSVCRDRSHWPTAKSQSLCRWSSA